MAGQEERLAEGTPHKTGYRRTQSRPSAHPAAAQDPERDWRENSQEAEDPNAVVSDDDLLAAFMDSLDQSVLPNLPPMPGYHVCWLTTTNPRDTIPNRLRMGYQLITTDMVPGFESATPKSAAYPGIVSINEMLAARIKLSVYNRMMDYVHHRLPLSEEEKLRAQVDTLKEQAERSGARLQEGDGMAGIVQRANPMPAFEQ